MIAALYSVVAVEYIRWERWVRWPCPAEWEPFASPIERPDIASALAYQQIFEYRVGVPCAMTVVSK